MNKLNQKNININFYIKIRKILYTLPQGKQIKQNNNINLTYIHDYNLYSYSIFRDDKELNDYLKVNNLNERIVTLKNWLNDVLYLIKNIN